jgi:hypothetical protein
MEAAYVMDLILVGLVFMEAAYVITSRSPYFQKIQTGDFKTRLFFTREKITNIQREYYPINSLTNQR